MYNHIRKGDCKRPPPNGLFPDNSAAQDNGKQGNIRAEITELGPPDFQKEPNFTEHEVDEVIRNLDDSKCAGQYGVDGAIVKRLYKCMPKFSISCFNKCFALGGFPKELKIATVIAIPKSDKTNLQSVQGHRGISLLSIQENV
jgi:hypothetical protein